MTPIDTPGKSGASREAAAAAESDLRRRAEALIHPDSTAEHDAPARSQADADTLRLVHELQVHQIELELQNAELIEARANAETALARYAELYDFAPVGYFTLGPRGEFVEVNLTGARLLGKPRSQIIGRRFGNFVVSGSVPAFNAFLARLFSGSTAGSSEVTLDLGTDDPMVVRMEGIASDDLQTCRVVVSDITGRKRAEAALRESEERFRKIFENAATGIAITDWDGRFLQCNPTYRNLLGYTDEELRRMDYASLIRPEHREANRASILRLRSGELPFFEVESCYARKDGRPVWVQEVVSLLPDAIGAGPNVIVLVTDMTERRAAEAALRESNAFNLTILDAVPSEIAVLDGNGTIIAVNQSWRRFALENALDPGKFSAATDVGANYLSACQTIDNGESDLAVEAAGGILGVMTNRLARFDLEYPCNSPDKKRWFSMSVTPLGHGREGVVVAHTDISERKEAEQAVHESAARLTGIVDSAMDAVISVDEDQRIRLFNPAAARVFGLSTANAIGLPLEQLVPERFRQLHDGHIHNFALTGATARRMGELGEIVGLRANGEEFPIEASISQTRLADGKLFTIILRDITERKRTEAALRELRNEMDQMLTLHVATQTAAAIAHELNQPLNAVATYSEAALRLIQTGNQKPERLIHAIEGSAQQAQRAGRVMRELIRFLQKGETPTEAVDLNNAVDRALAIVESNGYGGFQTELNLAPDLKPVKANRLQVEKVLVNLLRNGVEAMRGAGVRTQAISIDIRTVADKGMAQVTIRDSGPGIDEQTAKRVFQPFFTTKSKGIGMGLSISRTLIESHGGKLWVDQDAGPGAVFHFTLPFVE